MPAVGFNPSSSSTASAAAAAPLASKTGPTPTLVLPDDLVRRLNREPPQITSRALSGIAGLADNAAALSTANPSLSLHMDALTKTIKPTTITTKTIKPTTIARTGYVPVPTSTRSTISSGHIHTHTHGHSHLSKGAVAGIAGSAGAAALVAAIAGGVYCYKTRHR